MGVGILDEMTVGCGEPVRGELQHHRIAIDANQLSGRADSLQDFGTVTACSDRAVDDNQSRCQFQRLQSFPQQNRNMNGSIA